MDIGTIKALSAVAGFGGISLGFFFSVARKSLNAETLKLISKEQIALLITFALIISWTIGIFGIYTWINLKNTQIQNNATDIQTANETQSYAEKTVDDKNGKAFGKSTAKRSMVLDGYSKTQSQVITEHLDDKSGGYTRVSSSSHSFSYSVIDIFVLILFISIFVFVIYFIKVLLSAYKLYRLEKEKT